MCRGDGIWGGMIPGAPASDFGRDGPEGGKGEKDPPRPKTGIRAPGTTQPAFANGSSGSIGSAAIVAGSGKAMMLPSAARSMPGRR